LVSNNVKSNDRAILTDFFTEHFIEYLLLASAFCPLGRKGQKGVAFVRIDFVKCYFFSWEALKIFLKIRLTGRAEFSRGTQNFGRENFEDLSPSITPFGRRKLCLGC